MVNNVIQDQDNLTVPDHQSTDIPLCVWTGAVDHLGMDLYIGLTLLCYGMNSHLRVVYAANNTYLDNEYRLKQYLLSSTRYSPTVRPKRNHSDALVISVTWQLITLGIVSEKQSELSHAAKTSLSWIDEYLTWEPNDYGGLNVTYLLGKYIWTPTIKTLNALHSSFLDEIDDDIFQVKSNGQVTITPSGLVSTICKMDPADFPYDCHTCRVYVSYGYTSNAYIKFRISDDTHFEFTQYSLVWDLESSYLDSTSHGDSMFMFVIRIRRKPLYYVCVIVVPSVILSVVIMAAYFIPEDEGEKIGCGMTILLTFIVFLLQMSEKLPETSNSLPTIGIYFMMLMTSCVLVIVDSVVMANQTQYSIRSKYQDGAPPNNNETVNSVTKPGMINRRTLFHWTCGAGCFLLIVVSHGLLLGKSLSSTCRSA